MLKTPDQVPFFKNWAFLALGSLVLSLTGMRLTSSSPQRYSGWWALVAWLHSALLPPFHWGLGQQLHRGEDQVPCHEAWILYW